MRAIIRNIVLALFITLLPHTQVFAKEIAGVDVPDSATAGEHTLSLNGAGIRKKLLMKLYVGSLYLLESAKDGTAVTAEDAPMSIRLDITSKMITSERMTEATMEGFKNSAGEKMSAIKAEIDEFMKQFEEPIKVGDIFEFVYLPGEGTKVSKNNKALTIIQGLPFKQALFGIWLSEKPAQKSLKEAMLGS